MKGKSCSASPLTFETQTMSKTQKMENPHTLCDGIGIMLGWSVVKTGCIGLKENKSPN